MNEAATLGYEKKISENPEKTTIKLPVLMMLGVIGIGASVISFMKYQSYVTQNYVLADTSGKNLRKDSYVYSYDKIVNDISGFFNIY